MDRGNTRLQYYIVSAVCTSAVTVGISFTWATPVLPKIAHNEIGFPMSKEEISWMVAISSIGFILGSCAARFTSDKFGRRATILGSSLPIIVGTILMICAWEAWLLSSGRFLWGCGTGMLVADIVALTLITLLHSIVTLNIPVISLAVVPFKPGHSTASQQNIWYCSGPNLDDLLLRRSTTKVCAVYIAEIADKDIRGRLALTNRFMLSFGGLLIITVGSFLPYQTLNYVLLALPAMYFISCWWIPESPYYLLKEGKVQEAIKTLQMLTGIRDENVLEEKISQMQSHVKIEMQRSSSVAEFLTGRRYRKAIFIVVGLKVPQIMTGLHAIQNYLGPILMESNSGMNITTAVIIFGACRFLLGIMSSVLVDRMGRRVLLVGSFIGAGLLLTIAAVYFGFQEKYGTSYPYNLIPFILIIATIVISVLGYESVGYLIPAEIFPMNVKSIAMAMTSFLSGFVNFLSVKTYQQIKDWIGLSGLFGTYAWAAFIGAVFCYFLVPETKGKSLKEIQIELNGNIYDEEEKLNNVAVNSV